MARRAWRVGMAINGKTGGYRLNDWKERVEEGERLGKRKGRKIWRKLEKKEWGMSVICMDR